MVLSENDDKEQLGRYNFKINVIKNKITYKKKKKTYNQYLIKLPSRLCDIYNINEETIINIELLPIEEGEKYPKNKIELKRNANKTTKTKRKCV
jgi:hypothetical protein